MSRLVCPIIFLSLIAITATSHAVEAVPVYSGDFGKLMGRWIVREVIRNGEPIQAQIGQEPGDVITLDAGAGVIVPGAEFRQRAYIT